MQPEISKGEITDPTQKSLESVVPVLLKHLKELARGGDITDSCQAETLARNIENIDHQSLTQQQQLVTLDKFLSAYLEEIQTNLPHLTTEEQQELATTESAQKTIQVYERIEGERQELYERIRKLYPLDPTSKRGFPTDLSVVIQPASGENSEKVKIIQMNLRPEYFESFKKIQEILGYDLNTIQSWTGNIDTQTVAVNPYSFVFLDRHNMIIADCFVRGNAIFVFDLDKLSKLQIFTGATTFEEKVKILNNHCNKSKFPEEFAGCFIKINHQAYNYVEICCRAIRFRIFDHTDLRIKEIEEFVEEYKRFPKDTSKYEIAISKILHQLYNNIGTLTLEQQGRIFDLYEEHSKLFTYHRRSDDFMSFVKEKGHLPRVKSTLKILISKSSDPEIIKQLTQELNAKSFMEVFESSTFCLLRHREAYMLYKNLGKAPTPFVLKLAELRAYIKQHGELPKRGNPLINFVYSAENKYTTTPEQLAEFRELIKPYREEK